MFTAICVRSFAWPRKESGAMMSGTEMVWPPSRRTSTAPLGSTEIDRSLVAARQYREFSSLSKNPVRSLGIRFDHFNGNPLRLFTLIEIGHKFLADLTAANLNECFQKRFIIVCLPRPTMIRLIITHLKFLQP